MKKLLFIITILFLSAGKVYASSPSIIRNVIEKNNNLNINSEIKLTSWIVDGNAINYLGDNECKKFIFDEETFSFVSFDSIYDFEYDNTTNCIRDNSNYNFIFPFYVNREKDIRPLWTITLRLNKDLNNQTFIINDISYNSNSTNNLIIQDSQNDNDKYMTYDYSLNSERISAYKNEYESMKKQSDLDSNNNDKNIDDNVIKESTNDGTKQDETIQEDIKTIGSTDDSNNNIIIIVSITLVSLVIILSIVFKKLYKKKEL